MLFHPRRAALLALLACLFTAHAALAQTYPAKPITIVIGYTPGAVSDLAARTIADGLHQAWGQPVIVDNRPGSGGNIGAAFVARAPADGYTLMIGTDATMASNVHLYKHVGFDPVKDFAPVAYAGANIICLAVNAQLPINSVADVIAYAKQNPGKLSYGSSGAGSPHHLAGELLRQKTGIDIQHVPYRGGGAAVNDLLGGHIGMAFLSLVSRGAASQHRQGAHDRRGGEDALRRDARGAGDRRDRAGVRDVVMDRPVRAGRHACRCDRKA